MLLTFDTCLDRTYIGLADKENIIDTAILENQGNSYHSAFLISTIRNLLIKHGLTPQNITSIATDVGPGSFTGIRACLTVAKVLAQQLNIKAAGISSLDILSKLNPTDKKRLVLLDARKNMSYVWDEEILGAIAIEDVKEMVKSKDYSIICDDAMYEIFSELTNDITSYTKIEHNLAELLIKITYENFDQKSGDWQNIKPLYIQPPPVFGK